MFDLILKNGRVATPWGIREADVAVKDGRIAGLGRFDRAKTVIDCENLHVLPGIIDAHVHFREPGLMHKEDLATGTLAAIAGGVTTIFEMPNTEPLTVTGKALGDKLARAEGRAFCDYAFYVGGCAENADRLHILERLPGACGVKVFMGSSTGNLLVAEEETLLKIFLNGTRRISLHAEDDARLTARKNIVEKSGDVKDHPAWRDAECALLAVKRAVETARKAGRRIHFLHVTSAEEMAFLKDHKDICTVETTPQHLTLFAPDCYDRIGTRAQMNPPIRDAAHRDALWAAITDGTVDVIGSDHAPHTLEEKSQSYPKSPSGMPGVQTMLPLMLDHVNAGRLSLERLVDLLCHGPQRVYDIPGKGRIAAGYDADFTLIDLRAERTITNKWIKSKCGWTPFDGTRVTGWPKATILRGQVVMWDDEIIAANPSGRPVLFPDSVTDANIGAEKNIIPAFKDCCA